MLRSTLVALSVSLALSTAGPATADDAAEIKKLIPAAAGMSLADLDKIAAAATVPKASDVEDQSLTLMFLTLKVVDDEAARKQFRFLGERTPKPSDLAQEINRNVRGRGKLRIAFGPVTCIQADRITDLTCKVDGDQAAGVVQFKVPNLYEGNVDYVARRANGKWRIEEFAMPARNIRIVRGENGKWSQKAKP